MTFLPNIDPKLQVARGLTKGQESINKFGESTNLDNGIATDIWDRANPADNQPIWVAPTTARIHDIVSSSPGDDGDPVGVGARTVRVVGLTSWDTPQEDEIITMNGTTNVPTTKAYVIIYRMKVLTWGASGPNVGTITATAQGDGTVTAQIQVGKGQTLMAIFGIPSTQKFFIDDVEASIVSGGGGTDTKFTLLVNANANNELTSFVTRHEFGLRQTGTSMGGPEFGYPKKVTGPAIIKVQGVADSANIIAAAWFDGNIVDN